MSNRNFGLILVFSFALSIAVNTLFFCIPHSYSLEVQFLTMLLPTLCVGCFPLLIPSSKKVTQGLKIFTILTMLFGFLGAAAAGGFLVVGKHFYAEIFYYVSISVYTGLVLTYILTIL